MSLPKIFDKFGFEKSCCFRIGLPVRESLRPHFNFVNDGDASKLRQAQADLSSLTSNPNTTKKMKHINTTTICAIALLTGAAQGAILFNDSFDYGSSDTGISSAGNWSSTSSVLKYDADGGLDVPQMSGESGGAMWLDFNDSRTASNSADFTTLNLTTLGAGDSVWMTTLFQYVSGNTDHSLEVAGGSVSGMGFAVSGTGGVSVKATLNTTVNATNGTGITLTTGTYLMLARYTKGSGTSPVDSAVDLWINPADASSVSALGTADWTLDSGDGQVKWGRDGNSLTSISEATPSQQGRIDEIRVATTFSELNLAAIPEPSTALLGALGLLALLRRRR